MNDKTARYLDLVSGRRRGIVAGLLRGGLQAASWPYGLAIWARNRAYDCGWMRVARVGVPVISVGNLTTGGTGKTPCVEYLARFLSDSGHRVTILSRGYGSGDGPNDEALVLEENLPDVPHMQAADRASLAATAIEELEPDVLVLDDGFQHRRLGRNLDIVLVDATLPWGFGYLTPRGLLREPPGELRRAGVVIVTRCDQASPDVVAAIRDRVRAISSEVIVAEAIHEPMCWVDAGGTEYTLGELKGQSVAAFCGIGNAGAFWSTLESLGLRLVHNREYADHFRYRRDDVTELQDWLAQTNVDLAVTTQKDLVKLRVAELGGKPLRALKIGMSIIQGEEQLKQKLLDVMK